MKPVAASTAYLLISHGSRDPRPQVAMNRLAQLVHKRLRAAMKSGHASGQRKPFSSEKSAQQHHTLSNANYTEEHCGSSRRTTLLTKPEGLSRKALKNDTDEEGGLTGRTITKRGIAEQGSTKQNNTKQNNTKQIEESAIIVETACLELAMRPLSEHICEFGYQLADKGIDELRLLPIFLMGGVHVMEDIPTEIETARRQLGDTIRLTVCPHIGSHPQMTAILKRRLAATPTKGALLVAHGSRRPKGNKAIQKMAKQIETPIAYWATPPDIETQVIELMQQGCQGIAILPYFLFAGGITDAIAHRTEELAERFPKVKFRLLPTLGATEEVADLAVDLLVAEPMDRI
ncbi:MAG: sirohydrochlorin chelatase [Phormidesmis sp.]